MPLTRFHSRAVLGSLLRKLQSYSSAGFQGNRWSSAAMSDTIPTIRLHNGVEMPMVGLGTFQGSFECDQEVVISSVKAAIDAGYLLLDTAQIYNTEASVGKAIREKITEGKVTRQQLFVTTKLWNTFHAHDDVISSLKQSLLKMGLDYVDLFLMHWAIAMPKSEALFPRNENGDLLFADEIDFLETWKAMEDVLASGLTRAIGICNFNQTQVQRLLDNCSVKPMNIQIESNPFFNNSELIEFCQKNGISATAFSPLGKPSRTWLNEPGDPFVATDPVLLNLASKYGKTPQQIALKFQVQRGVAVVPKSNTPSRIIENRALFDFTLTDDDMEQIRKLDRNFRILWIDFLRPSKEYPFGDAVGQPTQTVDGWYKKKT